MVGLFSWRRQWVGVVMAATAVFVVLPAGASAWTATVEDGTRLVLVDALGRGDAIVLQDDGASLRIVSEAQTGLEGPVPAGCASVGVDLLCPASSIALVEVHAGDGDDRIENASAAAELSAFGDAGRDSLLGAAGSDVLDGGAGDDRLNGGSARIGWRAARGTTSSLAGPTRTISTLGRGGTCSLAVPAAIGSSAAWMATRSPGARTGTCSTAVTAAT